MRKINVEKSLNNADRIGEDERGVLN